MSKVRKVTGWLAIVALLFAQLAVAAYACPEAVEPATSPAASFAKTPCDQLDAELSNLCQKHCHDAEQSQAAAPLPPAFTPGFTVHLQATVPETSISPLEQRSLLHIHPPPITIRNCCFRI